MATPQTPWLTDAPGSFLCVCVTTQAVIASKAKQSPSRKEEIASSQKTLLAMTLAEQLRLRSDRFTVLQGWTRCGKISEIFTNMATRSNQ